MPSREGGKLQIDEIQQESLASALARCRLTHDACQRALVGETTAAQALQARHDRENALFHLWAVVEVIAGRQLLGSSNRRAS